ncbi:hypothetical protein [Streptomyces nigra]
MDDSLSFESFLEGAKKAAHKAMDDHARREYDEFALHAGVAIERLSKAVLSSKNPIYIAEMKGSAEMLFHLGGHRAASKVRTIGASEAVARLRTLGVLSADRQLDLLIDLRNGVAHASTGDQAKSLLSTFSQTVASLMEDLGGPMNAFWGRWTSAVRMAVDNKRSQVEREVQLRVRQAKHRFDDRFAGLPEGAKELVLTGSAPPAREIDFSKWETPAGYLLLSTTACPACDGPAAIALFPPMRAAPLTPSDMESLHCPLCDLQLTGQDEIKAAKARLPWKAGRAFEILAITGLKRMPSGPPDQIFET